MWLCAVVLLSGGVAVCGCVVEWRCGCVALCGCVFEWQCGCVGVRLALAVDCR